MVENNDNLHTVKRRRQQKDVSKPQTKENRRNCILFGGNFNGRIREREKETGKRREGWEKKIQRQGGKCRGEETDQMDRRK
jgi:hypothetical protein